MSEKITKQAKKIMDNFVAALDKAHKQTSNFTIKRKENMRSSTAHQHVPEDFTERMLRNAPQKKGNLICAERKKW